MLSKDILDQYKPWLVSIARTGSSSLPWIYNPRDIDYMFYVTDNTLGERMAELYKQKPSKECWLIDVIGTGRMKLAAYQYRFAVPVYGEDFPTYDVLEHIPEYKRMLVKHGLNQDFDPLHKFWYHILTGIYLIQNNSYELTEEQAQNVRLCHGKQMTRELYEYIQAQLLDYEKEFEQ